MMNIKISDWIHTVHSMNKITGFVTNMVGDNLEIFVTIPKNYGTLIVKRNDIVEGSDMIWLDDLPTLIGLALDIRDKEWFDKWVYELSLWIGVGEAVNKSIL